MRNIFSCFRTQSMATNDSLTYTISAVNEPREKRIADVIPSETEICIAATFKVPSGNEPRKLTSMPVKKILSRGCIKRKYESPSKSSAGWRRDFTTHRPEDRRIE